MKTKIKKLAVNLLFYLSLAAILFSAVFLLVRGKSKEPIWFFGHSFLWVETGSMQPTIEAKSYIMVRRADGLTPAPGDVIVFTCRDSSSPVYGSLITHRIVAKTENGYRTKGDSTLSAEDPWTVAREDVVAVYEKNLPMLTFLGRVLSSKTGFALLIGVFLAICGLVYIPSMVKDVREEAEKATTKAKEREIARLVAQEVERLERENGEKPQKPGNTPHDPESTLQKPENTPKEPESTLQEPENTPHDPENK